MATLKRAYGGAHTKSTNWVTSSHGAAMTAYVGAVATGVRRPATYQHQVVPNIVGEGSMVGQVAEWRKTIINATTSAVAATTLLGVSIAAAPGTVQSGHIDLLAPEVDPAVIASIGRRLGELRNMALEEGITWNELAEAQLWTIIRLLASPTRPAIAVDESGDIRALWENMLQEQVGIRFKGQRLIEAVLFQRTEHGFRRQTAQVEAPELLRLIREMKLVHVTRG